MVHFDASLFLLLECSISYILHLDSLLLMGRTIPSFRIVAVLEEEKWKAFRKYLRNQNQEKLFTHMFSIANYYNSISSNTVIPIRINPILMSIVFHHYKTLKEKICLVEFCCCYYLVFSFSY
jgi:hypothetical protein